MKNFNLNAEKVGKFLKNSCKFAACTLVAVLPYLSTKDTLDAIRYSGDVSYSDAVGAVMSSSMWSENKREVIGLLKKDADAEFYRAVIQIVKSSMWSEDKVKAIKNICGSEN